MNYVKRLVAALMLVPLILAVPASADTTTTTVPATSSTTTTTTSSTTTTVPASTTTTTAPRKNPFAAPAVRTYLHSRTDRVAAGVYDVRSGQTYLYRPNTPIRTASMSKAEILAALLYQTQQAHRSLTSEEKYLATEMIEYSNNDDAQELYIEIGQLPGITAFSHLIGQVQTTFSWDWGSTDTTPRDELQVLKTIALPNRILDAASRSYEMYLMEHVVSYDRFGVGTSAPPGAVVGEKNGWRPDEDFGWEINTSGFVKYQGRFYLCVAMSDHNSGEMYGIDTVTTVARDVFNYLRP